MPHAPGQVWRAPTAAEARILPTIDTASQIPALQRYRLYPWHCDLLGRGICSAIKRKALALADPLGIVSEKAH